MGCLLEWHQKRQPIRDDQPNIPIADWWIFREHQQLSALSCSQCSRRAPVPKGGIRFRRPGAFHRARWMAKLIYALKIFLFRCQSHLTRSESVGLKRFIIFTITTYISAWYAAAPCPTSAPAKDPAFAKSLFQYPDEVLQKATVSVFSRHLWYISDRVVGLAFFDKMIKPHEKRQMVRALKDNDGSDDPPR